MDCGAPIFRGPGAEKVYGTIINSGKLTDEEKQKKREEREKILKEYSEKLKKKQRP